MSKKILLIDDDAMLCNELKELLSQEGYVVEAISDSKKAIGVIGSQTYDLCILDYKMKGITGIDLLKIIKGKNPDCPVIIVSGRPFIEKLLEKEKLSSAVAGVIPKPFDIEVLLQKIQSI